MSFTGLESTYDLYLAAFGEEPEDTAIVKLRYSTTDANIQPIEQEVKIVKNPYYPIKVNIEPAELMPGDTALITLEHRVESYPYSEPWNYTYETFPPNQIFDLKLEKGKEFGAIFSIVANDTADEFRNIEDGFYFIANDTINSASAEISIRARTVFYYYDEPVASTNTQVKNKKSKLNSTAIIFFPNSSEEIIGLGKAKIGNSDIEIMLGETKYFGVKTKDNKYKIAEIVTSYGEEPKFTDDTNEDWKWIKDNNVWGSEPIEKLGTKSGVYWEKKYPMLGSKEYDDGIYIGRPLDKMENVPDGMLRLTGRYWEAEKENDFKVNLKSAKSAEVEVKVIKPKELGDKNHKPTIVTDETKTINIDSVCIVAAGIIGIPPQIIKGQMHKQSGFRNSFRYEPRLDIKYQNKTKYKKEYIDTYDYYDVTSTSMGTIAIPSTHTNVKPVDYVRSPKKISDYLVENINNYVRAPELKNGKWEPIVFVGYEKGNVTTQLQKDYNYAIEKLKKSVVDATAYAKEKIKAWLKTDGFPNKDNYQQSRIFSSYGMIQQIFFYACDEKLADYAINNKNQTPESLNEIEYSIKAYKTKISKKLNNYSGNEWDDGFEKKLKDILNTYNPGEDGYGSAVFTRSFLYLPKN